MFAHAFNKTGVATVIALVAFATMVFSFNVERVQAVTLSELVELYIALEVIQADKAGQAKVAASILSKNGNSGVTSNTTPSGTKPAQPATPAKPSTGKGGGPATPAIPANSAQPAMEVPDSLEIEDVKAVDVATTSVSITWVTNRPAGSEVYYASSSSVFDNDPLYVSTDGATTSHGVALSGLTSGKEYFFVAVSKDAAGNTATSSVHVFTTLAPEPPISSAGRAFAVGFADTVWRIDTETDTVTGDESYSAGNDGAYFIALSKENNKVYVSNRNSTVSVIDMDTLLEEATIYIGDGETTGIAVSPDGKKVYVGANVNRVITIDADTNTIEHVVTSTTGVNPFGLAVHPDGSKLYVAIRYADQSNPTAGGLVRVYDTATMKVLADIPAGYDPLGVVVNNSGTRAYAVGTGGRLQVIDTATNTVITTVGVQINPWGIAVGSDDKRVYVANRRYHSTECCSGSISVIDASNNTNIETVKLGEAGGPWHQPHGLSVSPDGSKLYIADNSDGKGIWIMDTSENEVIGHIPLGYRINSFGEFIVSD